MQMIAWPLLLFCAWLCNLVFHPLLISQKVCWVSGKVQWRPSVWRGGPGSKRTSGWVVLVDQHLWLLNTLSPEICWLLARRCQHSLRPWSVCAVPSLLGEPASSFFWPACCGAYRLRSRATLGPHCSLLAGLQVGRPVSPSLLRRLRQQQLYYCLGQNS